VAAVVVGFRCAVAMIFDLATTPLGVLRDTPHLLVTKSKITATKQRSATKSEGRRLSCCALVFQVA
jgi:hypothetical protein